MKRKISLRNITIIALIYMASLLFIDISLAASSGKVSVETANLRQTASSDSKILEQISINENVEIIEKQDEWYKVKYKGITGFLRQDLLTVQEEMKENSKEPEEQSEQEQNNDDAIAVNSDITSEKNTNLEGTCKLIGDTELKILPLINASNINTLKKDIQVNIIETINNWAWVESDTSKGWVLCKNLQSIDEAKEKVNEDNKEQEKKEEIKTRVAYIKTESVNLRKEANTNCEVIKSLKQNTEVTVISEDNNWCKVKVDGKEGYISASLLSDKKQETSRSIEQTRKVEKEEEKVDTNTNNNSTNNTSNSTVNNSDVISYAKQYLGCKYVYGGTTPKGFDCSGFTQYVYKHFGVSLNRTAAAQYSNGKAVTNLQSGDLVMFGKSGINHVGIYIGGGTFIHAANQSRGVTTDTLLSGYYKTNYVGARRVK